jgi:hypothetical protein
MAVHGRLSERIQQTRLESHVEAESKHLRNVNHSLSRHKTKGRVTAGKTAF